MLKVLLAFMVGVAAGVGLMWYGPENAQVDVVQAVDVVGQKVTEEVYDRCQSKFLRDTSCLQNEPVEVCKERITALCGPSPTQKGAK